MKQLIELRQQEIGQVYPGLNCFRDGVRSIPVDSIPGLKLTGWAQWQAKTAGARSGRISAADDMDGETLYQVSTDILPSLNSYRSISRFSSS